MKKIREFVVNKNDADRPLIKFLEKTLVNISPSLIYKSVRKGRVRLNGKKITDFKVILNVGDVLNLYINDEFFPSNDNALGFLSASDKLSVVYEDQNIMLLNKNAGLDVHKSDADGDDNLINRILKYLYNKGEYSPENENSFVPALCNRIDRNTCGIVIAAKNASALRIVNEQIKTHNIEKKYLLVCRNTPQKKEDEITLYLKKIADKNICLVSEKKKDGYKDATTKYRVLKTNGEFSLVEATLKTGRTHQIRATFAHIGCPLLGDGKYGKSYAQDCRLGFHGQALCSYYIKFNFKDAGELGYLAGKSFSLSDVWFQNFVK